MLYPSKKTIQIGHIRGEKDTSEASAVNNPSLQSSSNLPKTSGVWGWGWGRLGRQDWIDEERWGRGTGAGKGVVQRDTSFPQHSSLTPVRQNI